ncbi:MAG: GntR family transcriptional regulator [Bacteroidota bacterium]
MAIRKDRTLSLSATGLVPQVTHVLTKAILEGDFKGGEQLVETELQTHFGISRSPLREAFRELEKQGLVVIVPRKGVFVKKVTRKDIEENFPVRAKLEGLAARMAATKMNGVAIEDMKELLSRMQEAVQECDPGSYYHYHLRFHEVFIENAENELLFNLLKNLRMQALWHRFSFQYYKEDLQKSFEVHRQIFDLFSASPPDPEAIEQLVTWHINIALDRFIAYLEQAD